MYESIPYLTIEDKINTVIFEGSGIPALILEGSSDSRIYGHLFTNSALDWSKIDIVIGESKNKILKYHEEGLPFTYNAIIDSDYDRYNKCCRADSNLIYTHFYSIENYLAVEDVIHKIITEFKMVKCKEVLASQIVNEAISLIRPFTLACLVKLKNNWPVKLEGISLFRWYNQKAKSIDFLEIKKHFFNELSTLGVTISGSDLDKHYEEASKLFDKFPPEDIDYIINGKRKCEAVYLTFKRYFPRLMSKRDICIFIGDLCKNIYESSYAKELLEEVDSKFAEFVVS